MTCAQGLLRLLWGGPKLECYGTGSGQQYLRPYHKFYDTQYHSTVELHLSFFAVTSILLLPYDGSKNLSKPVSNSVFYFNSLSLS